MNMEQFKHTLRWTRWK